MNVRTRLAKLESDINVSGRIQPVVTYDLLADPGGVAAAAEVFRRGQSIGLLVPAAMDPGIWETLVTAQQAKLIAGT